jgi:hypothetical protein
MIFELKYDADVLGLRGRVEELRLEILGRRSGRRCESRRGMTQSFAVLVKIQGLEKESRCPERLQGKRFGSLN